MFFSQKKDRLYLSILLFSLLFLIVADLLSKWWARHVLRGKLGIEIFSFLEFTYAENRDVGFSILSWMSPHHRHWLILFFGISMTLLLLIVFIKFSLKYRLFALSNGLILAGAVGNLIDRLWFGYVTDFIHFHFGTYSWPVFNIADICITVGVLLLSILVLLSKEEEGEETDLEESKGNSEDSKELLTEDLSEKNRS